MNKLFWLLILTLTSSCSSAYVLHWRESTGTLNFFSSPKESSRISHSKGVALLYDRNPYVPLVNESKDGSATVFYSVVIENTTASPVNVFMDGIKLKGKMNGTSFAAAAQLDTDDQVQSIEKLDGNSRIAYPVRFKLTDEMVDHFEDGSDALELVVPVGSKKNELKLALWLWEE